MKNEFLKLIVKIAAVTVLVVMAITLIYFAFLEVMPGLIPVLRSGDEAAIEEYLAANGSAKGIICTVILQIVTIVSVVISSVPVQMASGVVYGTLRGFCICHLASVATHTAVFYAARKLGARLDRILGKGADADASVSKYNFLAKSDMPEYATALTYLIPVIPNGIIPYIAAKTDITLGRFAIAVYCGTLIPILVLCAAGAQLISGDFLTSVLLLAVLFVLVAILWKLRDRIMGAIRKIKSHKTHKKTSD